MMHRRLSFSLFLSLVSLTFSLLDSTAYSAAESITIIQPENASLPERLAAREIRRYLYLRTGDACSPGDGQ